MSQYPYGMPPPVQTDPTDVAWLRVGAWCIDAVIYVVVINVVNLVLGTAPIIKQLNLTGSSQTPEQYCQAWNRLNDGFCIPNNANGDVSTVTHWQPVIFVFIGLFVLYCVVQGLFGASIGKLALGLRVVKADGRLAGMAASFVRTFGWIIDAITCGIPVVGGIAMFSTTEHRRVGDMMASTFVVRQRSVGRPVSPTGPPGYGQQPMPTAYAPYPGSFGAPPPGGFGGPAPGGYGGAPSSSPNPWAPPGGAPTGSTPTRGPDPSPSPAPFATSQTGASAYEADVPSWDPERNTYIQYDSAREAWLEYDQSSQQWKPIST